MNPSVLQEVEEQTSIYGIRQIVSNAFKMLFFKWSEPIQQENTDDLANDLANDLVANDDGSDDWSSSSGELFPEHFSVKNSKLKKQKAQENNIEKKTFANKRTAQKEKKNATIHALEKMMAVAFKNANLSTAEEDNNSRAKKPTKKQRMRLEQKRKNDRSEKNKSCRAAEY
jgi:hypothetical protein